MDNPNVARSCWYHSQCSLAVVMARFARDCLTEFCLLTHELERTLGPDTADLGVRCGLHSGAVTGGVIRAGNARFQLFGDTVRLIQGQSRSVASDSNRLS